MTIVNFSELLQATISVDAQLSHIVFLIENFAFIDAVAFGGRYREEVWQGAKYLADQYNPAIRSRVWWASERGWPGALVAAPMTPLLWYPFRADHPTSLQRPQSE